MTDQPDDLDTVTAWMNQAADALNNDDAATMAALYETFPYHLMNTVLDYSIALTATMREQDQAADDD
ncbi:hypothetical protein [Corynebacterium nuruki]|uniref:hypothetical protein n=1 Tax=Corynebacterium nuruki TaxID=1032851 RepID=UPI0039BF6289